MRFSITHDKEPQDIKIKIKRNTIENLKKNLKCSWVDLKETKDGDFTSVDDMAMIGFMLKITPSNSTYYYPDPGLSGNGFKINNLTGQLSINKIPLKSKLSNYINNGTVNGFSATNTKKVTLDERTLEMNDNDIISVSKGDIHTKISDGGDLIFNGVSSAVYKNQIRINKTLWENSATWSLTGVSLISAILLTLGFIIRKFIAVYNKNEKINKIF
ncbi:hypothetical protein [Rahnella variigena]|uniref:hypothetical protein n=1 Tax=Rahnella variigena TaxID=574964 RepID=UPI00132F7413|nr:hypothetical protein [Rahnella variigena]